MWRIGESTIFHSFLLFSDHIPSFIHLLLLSLLHFLILSLFNKQRIHHHNNNNVFHIIDSRYITWPHIGAIATSFSLQKEKRFRSGELVERYTMGSANGLITAQGTQPLFSFGLISDVQYADIPDGRSFLGIPRYYRHSILVLQRAVKEWNTLQKHKFVMNFGDIVDGYCPKDQSLDTVKKVVDEFEVFRGPVYHMIGNHCLYNLPRSELLPLLKIQTLNSRAYYDFSPVPEYRFVVLDGYDISAVGWPQDHPRTLEALKFLGEKNPNEDKNSPTGLVGLERRFLKFNGGVGKEQLEWLDGVLQDATKSKQKVVVCCHLPLDPGASSAESLLWNYDEVMDLIHRYNCVKVCLAGHAHQGGYSVDSHGVHHRVLEAALECPPGTDAFGNVDVYDDRILLVGIDRMEGTDMKFDPKVD